MRKAIEKDNCDVLAKKKTVPKKKNKRRRVTNPIDIQGKNSNTQDSRENGSAQKVRIRKMQRNRSDERNTRVSQRFSMMQLYL